MNKKIFALVLLFFSVILLVGCDSSTGADDTSNSAILNASSLPLQIGREWNYSSLAHDSLNNIDPESRGTSKYLVLSTENLGGLNGFKLISESWDWENHYSGYSDLFISTASEGIWSVSRNENGEMVPFKILPFGTSSFQIRSEQYIHDIEYYDYHNGISYTENVTLNAHANFSTIGIENISTSAGSFPNCKKVKVVIEYTQKSEVSGVVKFNGKTWTVETILWFSDNVGLVQSESKIYTVLRSGIDRLHRHDLINLHGWVIKMTDPENPPVLVTGNLRYLGKSVTQLTSKNF